MNKKIKALITILAMLTTVLGCSTCVWAFTTDKVINVKQIDADEDMVEITWDDTGATEYVIQYSANASDWTKAVGETTSTSNKISIYNRTAGMSYYVRVKAIYKIESETTGTDLEKGNEPDTESDNAPDVEPDINVPSNLEIIESQWSDVIDVVTTPKKNITIVQTGATKSSASFKWDAVAGATSYNIYKKSSGNTVFYANVITTSVNVTGLGTSGKTDIIVAPVRTSKSGFSTECYNVILSSQIKIQPGKIKDISFISFNPGKKQATLAYGKQDGTTGADIQIYTLKGKKPIWKGTTTKSTKTVSRIKANSFYKVRMRAYTIIGGKKKYGSWSDYVYCGNQVSVKLSLTFNRIYIEWEPYDGATSYDVYVSDDNVNYVKVKTLKATSTKIKKIGKKKVKSGKNYYVYVVANKKVNKKKYSSLVKNSFFLAVK